jgi:hypothetical protein
MDVDASGRELGITVSGIDGFAFDCGWWARHRRRFRAYVLGETCFDNVFASIMATHGNSVIENRAGEIRHERHPMQSGGPFSRYNYYLAALDSRYFSLWAHYVAQLERLRERGATEAEERVVMERMFVWRRAPLAAVWHAGRCVRARWRYARDRAKLTAPAVAALR